MQSEWPRLSFAELVRNGSLEIGDGYRAKNDELGGEGLIFLRAGHVTDTHIDFSGVERFKVEGHERFGPKISRVGDVVVTTKGNSTGRVTYVTQDMPPFVYSPHLSYWRSRDRSVVHPGFLRAWSRGAEFASQLAGLSRSTDMAPYLSLSDQRSLTITLPPLAYQEHVATLGNALEDRIDLLRQTNATLESIAQALFKSWFIDFDPVRARQAGREPEGMDAATAALFPAEFQESALGLIPKGWRVATVGEVFPLTMGQSPPGETYNQEGDGLAFYQGRTDFGFRFPVARVYCTAPTRLARAGDVLVSVRAPVGDVNVALEPCAVGRGVAAVAFDSAPAFALYSMKALRDRFTEYESHGTVFGAINKKQFESLPCVLPSADVLTAFSSSVAALDERLKVNELQTRSLTQVRDTLLPRLISGKLRLPEAQEQLEDALA